MSEAHLGFVLGHLFLPALLVMLVLFRPTRRVLRWLGEFILEVLTLRALLRR